MLRFLLGAIAYFVLYQLTGSILVTLAIAFVVMWMLAILMMLGGYKNDEHYNEW